MVNEAKRAKKLQRAVKYSRDRLRTFRDNRKYMVQQMVGRYYRGKDPAAGDADKMPLPMLATAIRTFMRHLVARRPRAMVTTPYQELKPQASTLGLALNHLLEEINFAETMEAVAMDAMFSIGIAKLGLCERDRGSRHNKWQPFVDRVSLDNFVFDMRARSFEAVEFAGDQYPMPVSVARELFGNHDALKPRDSGATNLDGEEPLANLTRQETSEADDLEGEVWLMDLYLPRERRVVTMPADNDAAVILESVDYQGPEHGPYRMLGYGPVPDQIMPLAPAMLWSHLHELLNKLYVKLANQALRQKNNTLYRHEADAQRIQDAPDGKWVRSQDPKNVVEVSNGGPDARNHAFIVDGRGEFNKFAGNLDMMAGLSPQSDTLGQDQLLAASANKTVEDMQDRTMMFARGCVRDLAWYLYYTPGMQLPLVKRSPGVPVDIPVRFRSAKIEGDFLDYNMNIEPYSMQYVSPASKLKNLMNVYQGIVLPSFPIMQQQGIEWSMTDFFKAIAQLASMDELDGILRFADGNINGDPIDPENFKPPNTSREVVRVNRPGGTSEGRDATMMQTLMGKGSQTADLAALGRTN